MSPEAITAIIVGILGSGGVGSVLTVLITNRTQSAATRSADWDAFTRQINESLEDCRGEARLLRTEMGEMGKKVTECERDRNTDRIEIAALKETVRDLQRLRTGHPWDRRTGP